MPQSIRADLCGLQDTLTRAESGGPIGGERIFLVQVVEDPKI